MRFDDFVIKPKCDVSGSLQKAGYTICIEFHEQCKHLQAFTGNKLLLETRLQSESFDTLDDLLWFLVQKL